MFALEIGDRYLDVLGVTGHPDGPWATQQARNLVMDLGDHVTRFRFLVRDRAGQCTAEFDAVMADAGIAVAKIPPRCPRANCFAERFVLTVRTEVTDWMLILGERHLRMVLAVHAAHYNIARPHRALRLRPPRPTSSWSCDGPGSTDVHRTLGKKRRLRQTTVAEQINRQPRRTGPGLAAPQRKRTPGPRSRRSSPPIRQALDSPVSG